MNRNDTPTEPRRRAPAALLVLCGVGLIACATFTARDTSSTLGDWPLPLQNATAPQVDAAKDGCITCHTGLGSENMHGNNLVPVGCADCHGGDPKVRWQGDVPERPYAADFASAMAAAHPTPMFRDAWAGSANPKASYALLNREKLEYVRFVNPGDLRVAAKTCGPCHPSQTERVMTSMMAHSAMVPGAGSYNNGVLPNKNYVIGEFYAPDGRSAQARMLPPPTEQERARGVLEKLLPVPRTNISQPGNIFRAAERGLPSQRGLGTLARVDFAHFVLSKTRLNDPYLWFLGTNDYAGEYRSSGCSACHVLYANDEGRASGPIAANGYRGTSALQDPTIPRDEPGHPIEHRFTTQIPTSQCLTCHVHQGSGAVANFAGYEWWDGETDGRAFYHADGRLKHGEDLLHAHLEANKDSKHVKFTSQHRSGWTFRNVYKMDQKGQLVDRDGHLISWDDPDWESKAVHLADHHFEAGMHCIDCHTEQDAHGDGKLYGEMINAVEIACTDCHGTIKERAKLVTSNPAGGNDLTQAKAAGSTGQRPRPRRRIQFEWRDEGGHKVLWQNSKVEPGKSWKVPQLADIVDPTHPSYNEKAAIAKTLEKDTGRFGDPTIPDDRCAHSNEAMTCYTCHTSWAVSCAGCHLAGKTNRRTEATHFWGEPSFVDVGYYSQGLRSDCLILGISGDVKGNKITTVRSASAPIATVENGNRAIVTHQQPTVASSGHSGHAFSPYVPHTVSTAHGQQCTSCHISDLDDNNAQLATRFNLGAHATDFVGAYVHIGTTDGITAVRVTDGWEPQPVIGSDFHQMVQPGEFQRHVDADRELSESHPHAANAVTSLQARGEYLFLADGPGGLRVFDIANIANKDVAQRIVSAPFSPLGHDASVPSLDATAVLLPTTVPMDPPRKVDPANKEQPVHELFGYAYVLDRQEGLIVVDVNTFVDGDPDNNFLTRAATYNPEGRLTGVTGGMVVGQYLYLLSPKGLLVVDIDLPVHPRLVRIVDGALRDPRGIDVQFRYAAITDAEGLKVFDVTKLDNPVHVPEATIPLADAHGVRVCRTYAYVAAGREGLAIVDVTRFWQPQLVQKFNAGGLINDAQAVVTGLTNASLFAYVADGNNGLRVVELWSPSRSHGTNGFSPTPTPRLIASFPTGSRALSLSSGLQRDRGVDESGNQIGVYGRLGSRPLDKKQREAFYLRDGKVYRVDDKASGYQKTAPRRR